ncbi:hypothetical protein AB6A40_009743 [Gnathostoma spinigerum]|uniref:Uncharacterized protein n=1 Tax=Gnathostoma spinigerum TaxID=75299 RepID=A0ABD6EY09_9BILA
MNDIGSKKRFREATDHETNYTQTGQVGRTNEIWVIATDYGTIAVDHEERAIRTTLRVARICEYRIGLQWRIVIGIAPDIITTMHSTFSGFDHYRHPCYVHWRQHYYWSRY